LKLAIACTTTARARIICISNRELKRQKRQAHPKPGEYAGISNRELKQAGIEIVREEPDARISNRELKQAS